MNSRFDNAKRLIKAATGEEYGDGMMVTDIFEAYAEPGYDSDDDTVIVTGDWNPVHVPGVTSSKAEDNLPGRFESKDKRVTLPSRLADALERIGCEIEWSDEWYRCDGCMKAVRCNGNSHHWKPSYAYTDDGIYCHECMLECSEDGFEEYLNNARTCLTWCEPSHVEQFGYVKWEPGNEHTYESGWHPGQTDDPVAILAAIEEVHPDAKVLFFLDESSMFYIRFSAYVKFATAEEETIDDDSS